MNTRKSEIIHKSLICRYLDYIYRPDDFIVHHLLDHLGRLPHLYLLCAIAVGEGGKHSIGEISKDQRTNRLVTETLCLSKKSEVNLKLSRRCMSGRPGQGGNQGV